MITDSPVDVSHIATHPEVGEVLQRDEATVILNRILDDYEESSLDHLANGWPPPPPHIPDRDPDEDPPAAEPEPDEDPPAEDPDGEPAEGSDGEYPDGESPPADEDTAAPDGGE